MSAATNMVRAAMISDLTDGGAALSCRSIANGLSRRGVEVVWLAMRGDSSSGARIASSWPDLGSLTLWRVVLAMRMKTLAERVERLLLRRTMIRQVARLHPTIVHLHNVHQVLDFTLMEKLPQGIPIVVTLHDMWWLTGACAFPRNCLQQAHGCSKDCPEARNWGGSRHAPDQEWKARRRYYQRERERVHFVGPSHWMTDMARRRLPSGCSVSTILHGVDLQVFRPLPERQSLRNILGLPPSVRHVVLTGAIALDDERKGGVFLKSALASLVAKYGQTMAVCSFGANSRPESFGGLHVQLGATRDPRLLNLWYNAADVFVLPSRMESFGLVYVEAMAAGTPSVAFRVSACPEVVFDGATGVLAEDGDADDLARGIREILESDAAHGEERRRYCRSVAESRFDLEREVGEYAQLYAQLSTK